MPRILCFFIVLMLSTDLPAQSSDIGPITLVIHGGAGTIKKENMTSQKEELYRSRLAEALSAGFDILVRGGTSLEAVTTAIVILEDSPLFNAGRGAVFTGDRTNELDASVMTGEDLNAGAVAGITTIKNPILAAREVLENSPHVMMAGKGAEQFAKERGLELADPSYFFTQERYDQLIEVQEKEKSQGSINKYPHDKYGTYADNNSCGVSSTGHGEFFIRSVAAYDVAARMKYKGLPLQEAAQQVIDKIGILGGSGGMIALDQSGEIAMPFNSTGMYRGFIREKNNPQVFIYK